MWCHHGYGFSTAIRNLYGEFSSTRQDTLVHDFCFIYLFLMGAKEFSTLEAVWGLSKSSCAGLRQRAFRFEARKAIGPNSCDSSMEALSINEWNSV